ncbi:MAG: GAF domain-containing protein [Phycisphaerales bacterium]|nr:GAF domain-containing protein [Phycisphaerales bacterium]
MRQTRDVAERTLRMQAFVDCAWDATASTGVSWIGFYLDVPGAPEAERLVLGPRRDRPACSPIGMHGACGTCLLSAAPLVVRDVRDLGASYIACDPRDRSELVVPCVVGGTAWGVLDVDSHEVECFSEADAAAATAALAAWGLTD